MPTFKCRFLATAGGAVSTFFLRVSPTSRKFLGRQKTRRLAELVRQRGRLDCLHFTDSLRATNPFNVKRKCALSSLNQNSQLTRPKIPGPMPPIGPNHVVSTIAPAVTDSP